MIIRHSLWYFFRYLKEHGLSGVKLVISDKASGFVEVLGDFVKGNSRSGGQKSSREKAKSVMEKLRAEKLDGLAKFIEETLEKILSHMDFLRNIGVKSVQITGWSVS